MAESRDVVVLVVVEGVCSKERQARPERVFATKARRTLDQKCGGVRGKRVLWRG